MKIGGFSSMISLQHLRDREDAFDWQSIHS